LGKYHSSAANSHTNAFANSIARSLSNTGIFTDNFCFALRFVCRDIRLSTPESDAAKIEADVPRASQARFPKCGRASSR